MLFRLFCFFIAICICSAGECARNLKDIQRCIRLMAFYEKKYSIPKGTLHSISLVETGTCYINPRYRVPWPWTLNIEGKGQHFDTAQEAKACLHKALRKGIKNIDVGCMQINLNAHPKAFSSSKEALEPESNIRYAAELLRKKYLQLGSWSKAVRYYHSSDSFKGFRYYCSVENAKKEVQYGLALVGDNTIVSSRSIALNDDKSVATASYIRKTSKRGGLLQKLWSKIVSKKSTVVQKRRLTR
jgi:hypothetical protein